MYKHVLFDLDGTLTDSKEGIIKSVEYALLKLGEDTAGKLDMNTVVGPPLMTTFTQVYGLPQQKAERLYGYFQERYSTIGKFENKPFDGILDMLRTLQDRGVKSYLATSKPQVHAQAIIDKFGLSPYLAGVSGSSLGGTEDKAEMIRKIIRHIGPYEQGDVVMVGDRKYDAIGARKVGLPVILVAFGYATPQELRESRPDAIADDVSGLTRLLLH